LTVDVSSIGSAKQASDLEGIDSPFGWQEGGCADVAAFQCFRDVMGWPMVTFSDLSNHVSVVFS
jgi:hypothetical protein